MRANTRSTGSNGAGVHPHPNPVPEGEGVGEGASARFREALGFLAGRPDLERSAQPASTLTLGRIRALLDVLGHPEREYPSVLIAGTKGKGSTAATIERALRAAGYRTGLYTQPHLHTIRERIRIEGDDITADDFADGLDQVRAAARSCDALDLGAVTTYELVTALALERFAAHDVDVAVLEVGLGGRLDPTNAVDSDISVLTSLSLDHTQILGDTLEAIAREKADIIKPGRACVSAPQAPEAIAVIEDFAERRGAQLVVAGRVGARWEQGALGSWDLVTARGRLPDVRLALRGGFQRTNAAVAASVLDLLEQRGVASVPLAAVRTGLEDVAWPGRLEPVPGVPPIVLDGAHNVESALRLREALQEEYPGQRPIYVLGIAADKDLPGIVHALCAPDADSARAPSPPLLVATAAQHPRAARAEAIADAVAAATGVACQIAGDAADALDLAKQAAGPQTLVVVTGSLHLVAEAREALGLAAPSGERDFDPWAAP